MGWAIDSVSGLGFSGLPEVGFAWVSVVVSPTAGGIRMVFPTDSTKFTPGRAACGQALCPVETTPLVVSGRRSGGRLRF